MYPGGGGSALFSRADPFDVDVATYPLLAQAMPRALHAELTAGDLLYLPCGWWHAVESPRGKRSVSVSYWANLAEGSKNDSAPTNSTYNEAVGRS